MYIDIYINISKIIVLIYIYIYIYIYACACVCGHACACALYIIYKTMKFPTACFKCNGI